jgi:hypothetical protein
LSFFDLLGKYSLFVERGEWKEELLEPTRGFSLSSLSSLSPLSPLLFPLPSSLSSPLLSSPLNPKPKP